MLKLRLPDLAALERFVADEVRSQSGVERTEIVVALASAKETMILPVAEADEE
jgi:Lrp/AsnC family leucine-responsive transcriptional regulator